MDHRLWSIAYGLVSATHVAQKIDPEVTLGGFKGPMCLGHIIGLIPDVPLEVTIRARHRKASELNPSKISCQTLHDHPTRVKT